VLRNNVAHSVAGPDNFTKGPTSVETQKPPHGTKPLLHELLPRRRLLLARQHDTTDCWGSRLLVRQLSTQTGPLFLDLSLDWRLLTFAIAVAITTLLLFGVVPALGASGQQKCSEKVPGTTRSYLGSSRISFAR
jgi:hypothetical protein